jgi:flagellar motor component MotA
MDSEKPAIHLIFCRVLYVVFTKIRREGLLSIERDVDAPDNPDSVFSGYPELKEYPQHFDFMLDLLRLLVNGYAELPHLTLFGDTARKSFLDSGGKDEALLDCIYSTIKASCSGVSPCLSVEFGRQAIPYEYRPSFSEFEMIVRSYGPGDSKKMGAEISHLEIETRIDEMFKNI